MSDKLMADVNVSERLEGIEKRIDRQDGLLDRQSELLDRMVITMEQIAVITERTDNQKEINSKLFSKIEQVEDKAVNNYSQLAKVTGIGIGISLSGSVVLAVFTLFRPLILGGGG